MGRVATRWTHWTALTVTAVLLARPLAVCGQQPGQIPGMGSMNTGVFQPTSPPPAPTQSTDTSASPYTSNVSFIDSAIPMSQVKLIIDGNYDDRRPTRDEYLFSKSGTPGSPGWWQPERSVDWQELTSYVEVAYQNTLSGFLVLPTRFVDPQVNPDAWGMADIDWGLKLALVSTPGMTTTLELRGTIPTRSGPGLSTDHYSIEPGLLVYLQPAEMLILEGELRYWKPLDGTDFAGDMVRYGLGASLQTGWITPVVEVIGWTILGGKEMVPLPEGFFVRSSAGEEIINGVAGFRFNCSGNADIYAGYGRAFTGDAWQHQFWRLEFRVKF